MSATTHAQRILRLASRRGLLRARDLARDHIPRATLSRLVASGQLTQVSRGLYALPRQKRSGQHQLAEVAARSPQGVFCLLTALRFHELTTQSPHEVWLAIPNKAHAPRLDYPPLRIVRFSGPSLTEGIESHTVDGAPIRVYSVAKTVADCFKYRNKIGLDVALEALRECRREKRASNDELWRYAKLCRVANIMRPYLESIE
jgi:predicted transcriptional regulator of viral defense system